MNVAVLTGIAFVLVLGVAAGAARPRRVSGVHVAARGVPPWWNGAAISSEFTSAAACLGTAGLIATHGSPMLWYPMGAAAGFVVILALVVAPLRRSGAYTLPDFAEWRLRSARLRRLTTCCVLVVGLAFMVAELHAAGVVVRLLTGLPPWLGPAAVAAAVLAVAVGGGLGSVTSAQAAQFWLKLVVFLGVGIVCWWLAEEGAVAWFEGAYRGGGAGLAGAGDPSLPGVLAVLLACALGTMGLPHVIMRVHTDRDGHAARRSMVATQAMLAAFCVVPPLYGLMGHARLRGAAADEIVLLLPARLFPGAADEELTGLLATEAFAAFLATAAGVLAAVGGALSARASKAGARSFRVAVVAVLAAALGLTAVTAPGASVALVLLGLSLSAATFCPLLVLGIWWRRLTDAGAAAGILLGGGSTAVLVIGEQTGVRMGPLTSCPAPVAVPVAFAAMVLISLAAPARTPRDVGRMMARMHLPEHLAGPLTYRSSSRDDR
ncbi:hypothetical protein GCM10009733_045080 [Nonomuraea maheshkhaliensis]|uniref:Cation acetate symporter n=1 Tax=Nonomuraea maheshkhaliensis TaxID=419590 RepID=A0ABN2FE87_9ACTN